jgi:hypothetical protein
MTLASLITLGASAVVVLCALWMRFALVALNQDMREILARQSALGGDLALAFELTQASLNKLEKRVKMLEDELL